jgi:hypothetical protein
MSTCSRVETEGSQEGPAHVPSRERHTFGGARGKIRGLEIEGKRNRERKQEKRDERKRVR